MTPEKMKEIVEGMNTKVYSQREFQKGFEILDNNGRPIGVWYSIMRARTFVNMKEDGTVRIDTPDLDTYEKKSGFDTDGHREMRPKGAGAAAGRTLCRLQISAHWTKCFAISLEEATTL